jgi:hypothetical protein
VIALRPLLPLLALGAALATAPAAGAKSYELHAGARSAHGFAVQLRAGTVSDFGGQPVFVDPGSVVVSRRAHGQTISRTLTGGRPLKVTAAPRLRHARVRLGLGGRGTVVLRFTPTGALHEVGTDNCDRLRGRRGTLRGRFRVRMGGVFHTLHRVRLQGTLAAGGDDDCSDPSPIGGDDNLTVSGGGVNAIFYRVAAPASGPPTSVAMVSRTERHAKHWTERDEIEVHRADVFSSDTALGPPPLTASAHVRAGGPFLTGALDYGPVSGIIPSDENTWSVPGPVTGSVTADFGRLGGSAATLAPPTGELTRECNQCI